MASTRGPFASTPGSSTASPGCAGLKWTGRRSPTGSRYRAGRIVSAVLCGGIRRRIVFAM